MSLRGCAANKKRCWSDARTQTRRTLAGDQPHLKGRRNLGGKPTIHHHHDPGGRMGVFVVGEAAAQLRSSRASSRLVGCVLGD